MWVWSLSSKACRRHPRARNMISPSFLCSLARSWSLSPYKALPGGRDKDLIPHFSKMRLHLFTAEKKIYICHSSFLPRADGFILLFSGPWKAFWVLAFGAGMVIGSVHNELGSCRASPHWQEQKWLTKTPKQNGQLQAYKSGTVNRISCQNTI